MIQKFKNKLGEPNKTIICYDIKYINLLLTN